MCPLLILWLIMIDDKSDTRNRKNNNDGETSSKCCSCITHVMKQIYCFYTAPIVKFCFHSVTTGNLGLYSVSQKKHPRHF